MPHQWWPLVIDVHLLLVWQQCAWSALHIANCSCEELWNSCENQKTRKPICFMILPLHSPMSSMIHQQQDHADCIRRVLSAERINQDQPVGESDCGSIRIYYKEEFKKQIEIDYLLSELPYQGQPLFQTHSIHLLMSRFSFAYKRGWVFSQFCLYCYLQHTGNCSNSFFKQLETSVMEPWSRNQASLSNGL